MEVPVKGIEFLTEMRERGIRKKPTFWDLTGFFDQKARVKGIPINGQFELTPLCNLDCRMCYVHMNAEQLHGCRILTVPEWKDLMNQAVQAGMIHATLTGGECLAYPGFDELYLYLQSLGCGVSVLTNGVLLDEKRIQFFREHRPGGIQVTLYGCNDDAYERVTGRREFETVSRNIRNAIAAGLRMTVTVTPSVYLGEDVLETIRVAKSLCSDVVVNHSIVTPRAETGRAGQNDDPDAELYVRIYRLMDELDGRTTEGTVPENLPEPGGPCHSCTECGIKCGAGRSGFMLNWKGNIQPCSRLDSIQANALEKGFREAWKEVFGWATQYPLVPECKGCAYEGICDNCAANMLVYAEPGKQPTGLCERTKYLVQNGVRTIPECD